MKGIKQLQNLPKFQVKAVNNDRPCRDVSGDDDDDNNNDYDNSNNNNSAALVRERTLPTELPPLVGEVSANFCG
jgi:hypothetical protein